MKTSRIKCTPLIPEDKDCTFHIHAYDVKTGERVEKSFDTKEEKDEYIRKHPIKNGLVEKRLKV